MQKEAVRIGEVIPSIQQVKSSTPTIKPCYLCGSIEAVMQYGAMLLCKTCRAKQLEDKIKRLIPPKFLNLASTRKELEQYSKEPKSLFIYGASGTGKTTFICNLTKAYLLNELKVDLIIFPEFMRVMQSAFVNKENAYEISKQKAEYSGILIIDEIGLKQKMTDFVKGEIYYLLNYREQHLLTTIMTSNMTLQEIAENIDDAIASRITGMCDVLHFQGRDMRVKNG